jgi:hypothetical protein
MKRTRLFIGCVIASVLIAGCGTGPAAAPTAAPAVPTATSAPTATPPPTPAWTPSPVSTPTSAPTSAPNTTPAWTPSALISDTLYADLLERVKRADPDVDFTALRLAYAASTAYAPYRFFDQEEEMYAALEEEDYDRAIELANQILAQNYLSPRAHLAAMSAYMGLDRQEEADYHHYVLDGLIASVLDSGDGTTFETAFVVILVEEEYMILGVLGIGNASQGLVEEEGHFYDKFEGIFTETGDPVTLYFNIDLLMQVLMGELNP